MVDIGLGAFLPALYFWKAISSVFANYEVCVVHISPVHLKIHPCTEIETR